jgi:hypothetical protein
MQRGGGPQGRGPQRPAAPYGGHSRLHGSQGRHFSWWHTPLEAHRRNGPHASAHHLPASMHAASSHFADSPLSARLPVHPSALQPEDRLDRKARAKKQQELDELKQQLEQLKKAEIERKLAKRYHHVRAPALACMHGRHGPPTRWPLPR